MTPNDHPESAPPPAVPIEVREAAQEIIDGEADSRPHIHIEKTRPLLLARYILSQSRRSSSPEGGRGEKNIDLPSDRDGPSDEYRRGFNDASAIAESYLGYVEDDYSSENRVVRRMLEELVEVYQKVGAGEPRGEARPSSSPAQAVRAKALEEAAKKVEARAEMWEKAASRADKYGIGETVLASVRRARELRQAANDIRLIAAEEEKGRGNAAELP